MSEDLTNLNWLSYAPIELNESTQLISVKCISTIKKTKSISNTKRNHCTPVNCSNISIDLTEDTFPSSKKKQLDSSTCESIEQRKKMNRLIHRTFHKRPQCSYSCLITMALKASDTGCLPVHLIYKYIEQEFPYFRTAPEGWKNSIRHNLSMNQNFIKVCRNEIPSTKKGFLWAINPSRMETLDQEIERTLKVMGRRLIENGEDRIPKQFSRNCEQLFSAVMNPPPTADHSPSVAMATLPTVTGKHHAQCSSTICNSSSYSRELYECVSRHVSLKTLNSISGLKLRNRRTTASVTRSSSKVDWCPLFPERQSSSEAVNHLFGVSVLPEVIEDVPDYTQISHHQLPRTLPGSPDHYPLSCDSDPPEASASVPTLVTTPVPISSRPFLCMEDDPYMIPQMFTCAESYVPHQLSFTSNSNCSSNILDTTGTATSSSTGTNGSRSSVRCCVYDYAGCCHTDDVAAYETAIEEECTFNCNESEQLFNCS